MADPQQFYKRFPPGSLVQLLAGIKMRLDPTKQSENIDDRRNIPRWEIPNAPGPDAPWYDIANYVANNELPAFNYRPFRYDPEAPPSARFGDLAQNDKPPTPDDEAARRDIADYFDMITAGMK